MPPEKDAQNTNDNQAEDKSFAELMGEAIDEVVDKHTGDNLADKNDAGEPDGKPGELDAKESEEYYPADTAEPEADEVNQEDDSEDPESDNDDQEGDDQDPELEEPEGLSEDASARFQALANRNKELTAELESIQTDRNQLYEYVSSSQATPEEFDQLVTVSRLAKSDNIEDRQQAYTIAKQFVDMLAPTIGAATGPDPLEGYDDLRQAVDDLEISEDAALELAQSRREKAARAWDQQYKQQQVQKVQGTQAAAQQSISQVGNLLADWQKDPSWKRKAPIIEEYAANLAQQVTQGQVHPSQVPLLMQQQYLAVTSTMERMTLQERKEQARNQPLRPGRVSGEGAEPEPKNFQEGMLAAMDKVQGINR